MELRRSAERLSEELDDVTPVHGVPITGLDEEDSMVTAISDVLASAKAAGG